MNKEKSLKINRRVLILIFFIIIETVLVKSLQYKIFPAKYFYDSTRILEIMKGITNVTDKSYTFTANFFKKINFLHLNTLAQWSYFLATIFIVFISIILAKNKKISLKNFIFVILSIGLLNIYVFNISKDIIQFFIFLIVYLIVASKKLKNKTKLILSCLVFLAEALVFRVYYGIMAMNMISIYFIYNTMIKGKKMNKKTVFKILIIALVLFYVEVFVVQLVSSENYNSIINARYSVNLDRESSPDAITIINDPFGNNDNFVKFMLNYIVNLIRMIFPFELVTKGVKYILFIIYQLFITWTIFKTGTKLNDNNILWLIIVISFIMISAIFEPDFGSFIRHESALFLVLFEMNKINEGNKERLEK